MRRSVRTAVHITVAIMGHSEFFIEKRNSGFTVQIGRLSIYLAAWRHK
jgi:hypothetical protein